MTHPAAQAVYGPRDADGIPVWEARREGRLWVLTYRGGPVRLTFESVGKAVAWARRWHDERGQG